MNALYIATYDSPHFTFEAYSHSQALAGNLLMAALEEPARQYHLALDWYVEEWIHIDCRQLGIAYRDREEIANNY